MNCPFRARCKGLLSLPLILITGLREANAISPPSAASSPLAAASPKIAPVGDGFPNLLCRFRTGRRFGVLPLLAAVPSAGGHQSPCSPLARRQAAGQVFVSDSAELASDGCMQ